jgi:hypothetical protein
MRARGVSFEVVYTDPHLVELVVGVDNGSFSGVARLYTTAAELADAARTIAGFPKARDDAREIRLGAPGPAWAGGVVTLRLVCVDGAGHAFVHAIMEAGEESGGIRQRAAVAVATEAAAIDDFVRELRSLAATCAGGAVLRGTG